MSDHLVIVGGGQAAAQAVQSLRQQSFAGAITLLSDEPYPPYQRPPLSKKYFAGELARERLLLATGSRARALPVPGVDLAGVHYFRTITDVAAIIASLAPGSRVLLIGAGYIGIEVAASARQRGFDVTVLEAA